MTFDSAAMLFQHGGTRFLTCYLLEGVDIDLQARG
jgi:hypothetical protein